nr:YybS family protein [Methylobacterium sp. OTU13CASTA1]
MGQFLGIGIGAGLVSALLFGVLLKATALAIILYLLAPLPILIVGLGWSHKAALVAAVTGSLALALVVQPFLGLGFLAYLALPAWWLAYLALLGRPGADGTMEWYPTGRLLAWTAGTAGLAFVAIAVIAAPNYETFHTQLRDMTRTIVKIQTQGRAAVPAQTAPDAADPDAPKPDASKPDDTLKDDVSDALARIAPGLAAQGLAVLLVFYLWAAAKIVKVSGRLPRPWPDLPSTRMPRRVLGILAVALLLTFTPGYPGVLGVAVAGALSAAFAIQGLAAFHDRSRGRPGRLALLFGLYLILFVTQGIAFVALTLFGIADTALDRRRPKDVHGRP